MLSGSFPRLSVLVGLVLTYKYVMWKIAARRSSRTRPPGPLPWFIIGNLFDLPRENAAAVYMSWAKHHGSDILFADALGMNILILNKRSDAEELLGKRGKIYSSRITNAELRALFVQETQTISLDYGDELRAHRRIYHDYLRPPSLQTHHPLIKAGVDVLLQSLANSPDKFLDHFKLLSVWLPLRLMYGYNATSARDPAIVVAEESSHILFNYLRPGSPLPLIGPIIQHLPSWLPGETFRRDMRRLRETVNEAKRIPWTFTKGEYENGSLPHSVLSDVLDDEKGQDGHSRLDTALGVAHTAYAAASDTILAVSRALVYVMATDVRIQARAHNDLDEYLRTTPGRLPTLEDRPNLPYIEAIIREALRWRPPAPTALPHTSTQDDHYNGYFIPKDTIVLPNIFAMTRDEATYPDPETFNPDRFFDSDGHLVKDDMDIVFGFGRRACPGKLFARDVLWLMLASLLTKFTISPKENAEGVVIPIVHGIDDLGVLQMTKAFVCDFIPRNTLTSLSAE